MDTLSSIIILERPLIFWGGLLVFISFSGIGIIATLNLKGKIRSSMLAHQRMALISILFSLGHGTLGLLTSDKPISLLLGSLTILSFMISAIFAYSTVKGGDVKVSVKHHRLMVYISLTIAFIHAVYSIFFT